MDITCNFQKITDTNTRHERFEEDDEAFYAELRRQILLLTADDDEDDDCAADTRRRKGSSNGLPNRFPSGLAPGGYFDSWGSQEDVSVPSWLVNVWRAGNNGTGVFIPQTVKHTRHGRGRMNNQKKIAYKPVQRRQP